MTSWKGWKYRWQTLQRYNIAPDPSYLVARHVFWRWLGGAVLRWREALSLGVVASGACFPAWRRILGPCFPQASSSVCQLVTATGRRSILNTRATPSIPPIKASDIASSLRSELRAKFRSSCRGQSVVCQPAEYHTRPSVSGSAEHSNTALLSTRSASRPQVEAVEREWPAPEAETALANPCSYLFRQLAGFVFVRLCAALPRPYGSAFALLRSSTPNASLPLRHV